jgi:pyruvate formate lyase activating enzyme
MHEALLYESRSDGSVSCSLCRHRCVIPPGKAGRCRVRKNRDGTLYSLVYGRVVAEHVDPVEKKPLFHFLPGSATYSLATVGCNFRCLNCQNHSIALFDPGTSGGIPGKLLEPEVVVRRALASGSASISYTYTEPTIFFEYALDVARLAYQAGLKNIFVTNGYITPEALDMIAPYLHAANIDLKGFTEAFYQRVTGAHLAEVLETITDYQRHGIWVEITTLVIPGENDDRGHLEGIVRFIGEKLGTDVPWHISRFFPQYKLQSYQPTAPESLSEAAVIAARGGLQYVYEGNIQGGREDTPCPNCGTAVLQRRGFRTLSAYSFTGRCGICGAEIPGVWS